MSLDFVYPEPSCGEVDHRPMIVSRIHYMYFALLQFVLTGINVVVISYAGKRPEPSKVGISTGFSTDHQGHCLGCVLHADVVDCF